MSTDAKKESGPATVERMSRRVACLRPGKKVLTPDIYADEYDVTEAEPEIIDEPSPDFDESRGFNPYDIGVLYKK